MVLMRRSTGKKAYSEDLKGHRRSHSETSSFQYVKAGNSDHWKLDGMMLNHRLTGLVPTLLGARSVRANTDSLYVLVMGLFLTLSHSETFELSLLMGVTSISVVAL